MQERTTLTLHLVGAQLIPELAGLVKYEEILHLLPQLTHLRVVCVGPLLTGQSFGDGNGEGDRSAKEGNEGMVVEQRDELCPPCQEARRQTWTFEERPGLYHDYARRATAYTRPDMCFLFNSGVHEFWDQPSDTWRPTLEHLVQSGVPLAFTAYNEDEMVQDAAIVRRLGGRMLVAPERNAFRGLHPLREPMAPNEFYYQNNYVFVARGDPALPASPSTTSNE